MGVQVIEIEVARQLSQGDALSDPLASLSTGQGLDRGEEGLTGRPTGFGLQTVAFGVQTMDRRAKAPELRVKRFIVRVVKRNDLDVVPGFFQPQNFIEDEGLREPWELLEDITDAHVQAPARR